MDFEQARQDITQWIVDFVEKPTPLLNGWPPCPYARQARLQHKVELRPGILDPYGDCELVEMGALDVIGYVYDPTKFTSGEFNRQVNQANVDWLLDRGLLALADHPQDQEIVNGVCMNQGQWAIMFVQDLHKLNQAAQQLAHKGFYHGWDDAYLTALFQHRKDPRA